jgi:hypothetical protein
MGRERRKPGVIAGQPIAYKIHYTQPKPGMPPSFLRMSNLIPTAPDQPGLRLDVMPEESVWLANFTSARTRRTYRDSIGRFIAFHRLGSAAALRAITPAHVIAWRDAMLARVMPIVPFTRGCRRWPA